MINDISPWMIFNKFIDMCLTKKSKQQLKG